MCNAERQKKGQLQKKMRTLCWSISYQFMGDAHTHTHTHILGQCHSFGKVCTFFDILFSLSRGPLGVCIMRMYTSMFTYVYQYVYYICMTAAFILFCYSRLGGYTPCNHPPPPKNQHLKICNDRTFLELEYIFKGV